MTSGAFNGWKVLAAWEDGKPANSGAFRTDGNGIWTYGVKLAHKDASGTLVLDVPEDWRYDAPTSNRHFHCVLVEKHNRGYSKMMATPWNT